MSKNDIIYGNDSDYMCFLDSECGMMWNVKKKQNSISNVTHLHVGIYSASNQKMTEYQQCFTQHTGGKLPKSLI